MPGRVRLVVLCVLLAALGACDSGSKERSWQVRGVVLGVQRDQAQVLIEHQDIPGFMPAMTMNFDVADVALLQGINKGTPVEFTLTYDGRRYTVTALRALGEAEARASGLDLEAVLQPARPAPPFRLTDQTGKPLALEDLRGRAVVLDFIYTHCPGPCPVLTGILRDTQQALSPELRARTRFVSITLDPERDTPEVLAAYARSHGLDTSDWSLLTGDAAAVGAVLAAYGVGTEQAEGAEIQHMVATFVIGPDGQIARTFLGTRHTPEDVVAEIEHVLG
jgi:protein SCO1/2